MSAPTLQEFEAALLARVRTKLMSASPPGTLRTVEAYQGQLVDWVKEGGFDGPAVLIHIDGSDEAAHSTGSFSRTVEAQLFIGVVNYRGSDEARTGVDAAGEVGAQDVLETCFELLAGHDLGLEIRPMAPRGFHSVIAPEQRLEAPVAIYRYDWTATWTVPRPQTAEEADAVQHTTTRTSFDVNGDGTPELESEVSA